MAALDERPPRKADVSALARRRRSERTCPRSASHPGAGDRSRKAAIGATSTPATPQA